MKLSALTLSSLLMIASSVAMGAPVSRAAPETLDEFRVIAEAAKPGSENNLIAIAENWKDSEFPEIPLKHAILGIVTAEDREHSPKLLAELAKKERWKSVTLDLCLARVTLGDGSAVPQLLQHLDRLPVTERLERVQDFWLGNRRPIPALTSILVLEPFFKDTAPSGYQPHGTYRSDGAHLPTLKTPLTNGDLARFISLQILKRNQKELPSLSSESLRNYTSEERKKIDEFARETLGQGKYPVQSSEDISFQVKLHYGKNPEDPTSPEPVLIEDFSVHNLSKTQTIQFSTWGMNIVLQSISPKNQIFEQPTDGAAKGKRAPPNQQSLITLKPGETHRWMQWHWADAMLPWSSPDLRTLYHLKRPGEYSVTLCLQLRDDSSELKMNRVKLGSQPLVAGSFCAAPVKEKFKFY